MTDLIDLFDILSLRQISPTFSARSTSKARMRAYRVTVQILQRVPIDVNVLTCELLVIIHSHDCDEEAVGRWKTVGEERIGSELPFVSPGQIYPIEICLRKVKIAAACREVASAWHTRRHRLCGRMLALGTPKESFAHAGVRAAPGRATLQRSSNPAADYGPWRAGPGETLQSSFRVISPMFLRGGSSSDGRRGLARLNGHYVVHYPNRLSSCAYPLTACHKRSKLRQ